MKAEDLIEAERQQREQGWGDIPTPLRTVDQWIVTHEKVPKYPQDGWQQVSNQLPFEEVVHIATSPGMEIAFVPNKDDPFIVFDLDAVVSDRQLSDDAIDIVETVDSYTELSRSGTGLHVFVRGERLPDHYYTNDLPERGKIEVFESSQCIVMTGDVVRDQYQITDGGGAAVQEKYLPKHSDPYEPPKEVTTIPTAEKVEQTNDLTAADIRLTIEEYAKSGSDEAERTRNYWTSSSTTLNGDRKRIESDMTFVSDLAFWCRENVYLMDACFRESERMFDRWERPVYRETTSSGRKITYGEDVIYKAKETNFDIFSGSYVTHR
jgi:putative DNA primase/helicase